MKVFLSIALVFLLLTPLAGGCASEPPPDVPRYTADQVLEVARAYSTNDGLNPAILDLAKRKGYPQWSTEYIGQGRWQITKDWGNWASKVTMYFDEESGSIQSGYILR